MRSNRRYWFDTTGNSRFQGHFQSNQLFTKILIDIPLEYIINNSHKVDIPRDYLIDGIVRYKVDVCRDYTLNLNKVDVCRDYLIDGIQRYKLSVPIEYSILEVN